MKWVYMNKIIIRRIKYENSQTANGDDFFETFNVYYKKKNEYEH